MNTKLNLTSLVLAGAASSALLVGCSDQKTDAVAPLPVYVTEVTQIAALRSREFTGTVRAHIESELSFRAGGKVVRRAVEVGDRVKAGQVIAVLDVADFKLGVEAAEDQVKQAKAQARLDSSDQARFGRLVTDGSIATADHERQIYRSEASDARLNQAQRQLQVSKNQASYTTLVAPFEGVITSLRAEVGQVVAQGQSIVSIARQGDREIVVDIPEGMVGEIRSLNAQASLWGSAGGAIDLKLREVSPIASPQGRTYRVKFVQSQSDVHELDAWPLGSTADLTLRYPSKPSVVLPMSALVNNGTKPTVWALDEGGEKLKPIEVKVLASNTDSVSVLGVPEHTRVVTFGAQKLDAGIKVRAIDRQPDEAMKIGRNAS